MRLDRELAANQAEPLAHAVEPHPFARCVNVEATAVVFDQSGEQTVSAGEHDADVTRLRVLDDVRQRLLHHSVECGLELTGEARFTELSLDIKHEAGLLDEALGEALDGRDEAEVV